MIKVSVIVPVYNVEEYIEKCINSIVNQTLQEIEVIIVNDGTTDNSQQIIDSFVEKYPNKVFSYIKENGGLSSARNYGIAKAKGEYIAFVDSDDCIDLNMYKELYEKASEGSFDLVCCNFYEVRDGKNVPCSCHLISDKKSHNEIKEAMIDFYPSAWNKLYKKELFEKTAIRFKDNIWFEDVEFIYRLLPFIQSIGVVEKNLYYYLIREGSITSTNDFRIYHYIENWNEIITFYKQNGIFEEYYDIIEYCYVRYLYATFIKTACKFNKLEFKRATKNAIMSVNENFPNYRQNQYILRRGLKYAYLKYFSKSLANLVYLKYHK